MGDMWLVRRAKTRQVLSSTPRLASALSAVLPPPQRRRDQNRTGVAKGTRSTCFKTKVDLINARLSRDQVRARGRGDVRFSSQDKRSRQGATCVGRLGELGSDESRPARSPCPIACPRDAMERVDRSRKCALG